MPILAGWGGKRKRIGNFGMQKCPNCHNWQAQGIYELSRQATLYFIPVAKWGKEYYVICPICEAGMPILEGKLEELLRSCITFPDDATTVSDLEGLLAKVNSEITKKGYREEHVQAVFPSYGQYLAELLIMKEM